MSPNSKTSPVYPEGWTGDMFNDRWHETIFQVKEEVTRSLDKYHQEETNYLNNKLQTNGKAEN